MCTTHSLYAWTQRKFVLGCMLYFLLLANGAFALPKSPSLGLNDLSHPGVSWSLSKEQHWTANASRLSLVPLQASLLNGDLHGLTTVSSFHAVPCNGEGISCLIALYSVIAYVLVITPIALLGAIIGHFAHFYPMRKAGNLALYPWLLVPPGFGLFNYSEVNNGEWLLLLAVVTLTSLVLATAGQVFGKRRLRNAGNLIYLAALAALVAAIVLS